jgi:hypothetical protein
MNDKKQMVSPKKDGNAYTRQPRPFLQFRPSQPTQPEEVHDILQVSSKIETFLFDEASCRFLPSQRALKIVSLTPKTPGGAAGFLLRYFRLAELRELLGRASRSEGEDEDILSVLDKLSASHKLKIISAEIQKFTHYSDCSFVGEIGVCVSEIRQGWTIPKFYEIVWYLDKPLDKQAYLFGGRTILVPSERVAKLRERRDLTFRKAFGWKDLGLESRLHREDLEDEVKLKTAILKLASTKIDKSEKPDEGKQE